MTATKKTGGPAAEYMALGLLAAAGGVLATPLSAGPAVLLALIATILMLARGQQTWQKLGQPTLHARNVLLLAFGGWFIAELISTAINNQRWTNLDYPSRFMLGIGVFWIIRYAAVRRSEILYFSIAISAGVAAGLSTYQHFVLEMPRSLGWTNFPIYFGNLSVLLCVYAVIVVVTLRNRLTKSLQFALVLAIPLLMLAGFLSGSRSSWLGLAGLLVLINWRRVNRLRTMGGGLLMVTILALILWLIPQLSESLRITDAVKDIQGILHGDYRSSIGDRLQMWKAALLMFWSSPLIGIGSGEYQAAVSNLVATGAVDIELIQGTTIFNQAHSEIMDILATKGLVGLFAYLGLLILPFGLFQTHARSAIEEVKVFGFMGMATIIAFLMFGLTLATFKVQVYCAVYPLVIALFAAMALNLSDASSSVSDKAPSDNR